MRMLIIVFSAKLFLFSILLITVQLFCWLHPLILQSDLNSAVLTTVHIIKGSFALKNVISDTYDRLITSNNGFRASQDKIRRGIPCRDLGGGFLS